MNMNNQIQYNIMNLHPSPDILKIYVTGFPNSTSDEFIVKLLETCGVINNWKRIKDQNDNNTNKGICEFFNIEGMLRAIRLLEEVKIDEGYEMKLKISDKTKDFVRLWRETKKNEWIIKKGSVESNKEKCDGMEWETQYLSKDSQIQEEITKLIKNKREIELLSFSKDSMLNIDLSKGKVNNNKEKEVNKDNDKENNNEKDKEKETKRMKERRYKRQRIQEKYEEKYKEEYRWTMKKEDEREKNFENEKEDEESLLKRKTRYIEQDNECNNDQFWNEYDKNKKYIEKEILNDRVLRNKYFQGKYYMYDMVLNSDKNKGLVYIKSQMQEVERMRNIIEEGEIENNTFNDDSNEYCIDINKDCIESVSNSMIDNKENLASSQKNIKSVEFNIKKQSKVNIKAIDDEEISPIQLNHINLKGNEREKERTERLSIIEEEKRTKEKRMEIDYIKFQKEIYWIVPQSKNEIVSFNIDWELVFEKNLLNNLKEWIMKKLNILLGEDNDEYLNMIISLIKENRSNYEEIFSKLNLIFDIDTEGFILLLYKSIIFEYLKYKKIKDMIV